MELGRFRIVLWEAVELRHREGTATSWNIIKIHLLPITTFSPGGGGAYARHYRGIGKRWKIFF